MKTKYIFAGFVVILATLTIWQIAKTNNIHTTNESLTSKEKSIPKKDVIKKDSSPKTPKNVPFTDSYFDQITGKAAHVREHKWITVRGMSVKVNRCYLTKVQKGWEDLAEEQPDLDEHGRIIGNDSYIVIDTTFRQKSGTKSLDWCSFNLTYYDESSHYFSSTLSPTSVSYFSKYLTAKQRAASDVFCNPFPKDTDIRTKFIFAFEDSEIAEMKPLFFDVTMSGQSPDYDKPDNYGLIYLEPEDRR